MYLWIFYTDELFSFYIIPTFFLFRTDFYAYNLFIQIIDILYPFLFVKRTPDSADATIRDA